MRPRFGALPSLAAVAAPAAVTFATLCLLLSPDAASGTDAGAPGGRPGNAPAAASQPARLPERLGLQLYSLRAQLARDVAGTLDIVKGFGVTNVELAGTYGLSPAAFRAELDSRGLRAVSAHFDFQRVRDDIEGVARDARVLGVTYVGGGWIPHDDRVPFDEKTCRMAIAVFNRAGEALARRGLTFFYHVHGYELQPYGQGTLLDLLMAETNPRFVTFQMDVFWVVHAGQDPVKLLDRYAPRWQLMHLKGMRDGTPTGLFTGHSDVANNVPLGTGKIDYAPVLRAAAAAGVRWYFIEDESAVSEQQIPQSLRYLASVAAAMGGPSVPPRTVATDGVARQPAVPRGLAPIASTLETVAIASMERRAIYRTGERIEAPNWSRDGQYFLFNSHGRIYRLPVAGGQPRVVDTGAAVKCNNDHGISPDGTELVVSDQSEADNKSRIYLLPITGGAARKITDRAPSYWHGWSPDGKTLAYCAERGGEFDIYTIPVAGGPETRLTTARGLDDGPDYSPDGRTIYFNSNRSGLMQIWRMNPDGSDQTPVTSGDDHNDWFPHPSPDGKWIVFLSYAREVQGHPENKDVTLRIMPAHGGAIRELAKLFGGQGTINVPSWSPDSQRVAFVSYEPLRP